MSHIEIIQAHRYYPNGGKEMIGRGGGNYIGVLDETTVLNYPCIPGRDSSLEVESQLLEILGSHPRIIGAKGLTEAGLRLQYAVNGDLNRYITENASTPTPLDQQLQWCKQAAEAVAYLHSKRIIHCDINLRNLLLDENLNLKLADFQGMYKSCDGSVLLDGLSRECTKSFLPRIHGDYADVETDLFALGSAFYFILIGHQIFPELQSHIDEDEEEIEQRFRSGEFPVDLEIYSEVMRKCWTQEYCSAQEVVDDIVDVQESIASLLSFGAARSGPEPLAVGR